VSTHLDTVLSKALAQTQLVLAVVVVTVVLVESIIHTLPLVLNTEACS
jgi:hypothetical protein